MAGRTKWKDIRAQRDDEPGVEERREAARAQLLAELEAHEAGLAELRRARSFTQTQLAAALEVSQAQVSRIERQADLYLSTLRSYLEAMGGRLELVATFEDGPPVALSIDEADQEGDVASVGSSSSASASRLAERADELDRALNG